MRSKRNPSKQTQPPLLHDDVAALTRAMVQTRYVPGPVTDEFHAQVAAGVLIRELKTLGWRLVRLQ